MTISELIAHLEALKAEHGDVSVYHHDDWDYFPVQKVYFEAADNDDMDREYWLPDRIQIEGTGI